MKEKNIASENSRLRKELTGLKKVHKSTVKKLDTSNQRNKKLQLELKKKDVRKVELRVEQEQLLSSLLPDINIRR